MMPLFRADDVRLDGTLADTYRPCLKCPGKEDADFKTVSIYRVDGLLPWWLTVEVHWCESGMHSDVFVRRTAAVIRPAVPADPAAPARRMFSITAISGGRRSILNCIESDSDYECDACGRPFGVTIYKADVQVPEWAKPEISWCTGCGYGFVYMGIYGGRLNLPTRPVESSATPATHRVRSDDA
jgi:hypothetical protein